MDNLKGIRIFREIVEAGGFAAAAERLGISVPMVSKYVADLEQNLGVCLLNRSSRTLSLTEAGSSYVEQCQQALDILDAAAAAVVCNAFFCKPAGRLPPHLPASPAGSASGQSSDGYCFGWF